MSSAGSGETSVLHIDFPAHILYSFNLILFYVLFYVLFYFM